MQRSTIFTSYDETQLHVTFKQQIGTDDSVRYRHSDASTVESIESFKQQLTNDLILLCNNVEQYYKATNVTFINHTIRLENSVKFEYELQGKLQGKSINEKFTKLSDLLVFSQKQGAATPEHIWKILKYTDETSDRMLFFPERKQGKACQII